MAIELMLVAITQHHPLALLFHGYSTYTTSFLSDHRPTYTISLLSPHPLPRLCSAAVHRARGATMRPRLPWPATLAPALVAWA